MINKKNLKEDLINLIEISNLPTRTKKFISSYYGIKDDLQHTLESIGEKEDPKLTRERVRQIINHGYNTMSSIEQPSDSKPFKESKKIFDNLLVKATHEFVSLEQLLTHSYFNGFENQHKGLISFFNDINVKQVVYRNITYLYSQTISKKEIIQKIQDSNKQSRNIKTKQKANNMSKTVTYVPSDIRTKLISISDTDNINLNRLYEKIIGEFIISKSYHNSKDFPKTQSWKARQGKAKWEQIGIYISKDIFDNAKKESSKINVSLMAFICQGFSWYVQKNNI